MQRRQVLESNVDLNPCSAPYNLGDLVWATDIPEPPVEQEDSKHLPLQGFYGD